ncbi:hypothetical protein Y032_0006g2776 [Ancylostoma ceylanicum]|uniref:Uncharacterized protein n=1 Tax=Ancylostoma ceylanicum TaxID=53326 RepID=A0A016VP61_9BILA|nr:hypothetical protein Y032_0006g2776 [Ancylostoma ceylanicum]
MLAGKASALLVSVADFNLNKPIEFSGCPSDINVHMRTYKLHFMRIKYSYELTYVMYSNELTKVHPNLCSNNEHNKGGPVINLKPKTSKSIMTKVGQRRSIGTSNAKVLIAWEKRKH